MDAEANSGLKKTPIWSTVILLWVVAIVFAFYDPASHRDQVQKSDQLSDQAWLNETLVGLQKLSDSSGVPSLKSGLDQLRSGVNAPYLLFEPPAKTPALLSTQTSTSPTVNPVKIPVRTATQTATQSEPKSLMKKRVLVVGASSIQFAIGAELEKRIPQYEGVEVLRFGKLASGLARPDFFDWPKQIKKLVADFQPDLMIANFGGNGAQSIPLGNYKQAKFRSPEWDEEYSRRVQVIVGIAQAGGADVVFLGMPNMRSKKFAKKMRYLNKVQKSAAEEKGALWIPTWSLSSDAKGKYRKLVRIGKKRALMRTSDGVHYSRMGARFVIKNVLQKLEREGYFAHAQSEKTPAKP